MEMSIGVDLHTHFHLSFKRRVKGEVSDKAIPSILELEFLFDFVIIHSESPLAEQLFRVWIRRGK